MSSESVLILDEVYPYYQAHAYREDDVLKSLRLETEKLEGASMQTSPEQGQALYLFLKMLNAKNVIELGTFTGYGTLWMAKALPEEGRLITMDVYDKYQPLSRAHWEKAGVLEKIDFRTGLAETLLNELLRDGEEHYDFVYIDIDKANYPKYYEQSLRLLRKGGVIALDNVLTFGKKVYIDDPCEPVQVMRRVNEFVKNDDRVEMVMLTLGHGLTLARKK